jgi:hypothetical protein
MGGEHSSKELFDKRVINYLEHLHTSPWNGSPRCTALGCTPNSTCKSFNPKYWHQALVSPCIHCQSRKITRCHHILTINVPVVFMARYVMVLRGATSLRGALEGVGPENRDFFGPWNGAFLSIWKKKIGKSNKLYLILVTVFFLLFIHIFCCV